jgi:hypothetical protein
MAALEVEPRMATGRTPRSALHQRRKNQPPNRHRPVGIGARPEAEERMQHATEATERAGVPIGQTAADFSTEASMDAAVAEMVEGEGRSQRTPSCLRLSGRSEAADQAKLSTIERFHVRFAPCSRPAEREFELSPAVVSRNQLKQKREVERVPNGLGEQLRRKADLRERIRAFGARPRCTAARQKRRNSLASAA